MTLRAGRRITARRLFTMAPLPVLKRARKLWFSLLESHYSISAAVERQKASQAHRDAAEFDKKAALARSARGQ